ncbi:ATP-binding cassette sub-family C member 5-like [Ptychodera flava]|uniref:ATP-binding cassette sub-family C member 5-like n=1 Tax=Ptychodera flava TaxID=63121 RepID=UPI00396A5EF0
MTDSMKARGDCVDDDPVQACSDHAVQKRMTTEGDVSNEEHEFARTYSFAEALQCHDFDLSTRPRHQHRLSDFEEQKLEQRFHSRHRAWKQLKPIRRKKSNKNHFPAKELGLLSFLYLTWLTPLIKKAYRHGLNQEDLWVCGETDSAEYNARRLEEMWKDEVLKKGNETASLTSVFVKFTRCRAIIAIICMWSYSLGSFFNTVLLRHLLAYVQGSESNLLYGIGLTCALVISETMKSLALSASTLIQTTNAVRLRCAIVTLVYQKVLKFRNLQGKAIGEIINLFTNDGHRVFEACLRIHLAVNGPFIMLLTATYTAYILGPAALLGSALFFLILPLQILFSKLLGSLRVKTVRITDTRVRMVNEMITYIKLIKMYAWEKPFAKKMAGIRRREKKLLQFAGFAQSVNISWNPIIQGAAIVLTFVVHIATGNDLTAATAFTVVTMFALARTALTAAPKAMKTLSEGCVAAKRMQIFLQTTERRSYELKPDDDDVAIHITMATFAWDKTDQNVDKTPKLDEEKTLSSEADAGDGDDCNTVKVLYDINFTLNKGQTIGVCGSVGSGKSSLMSAILAQMQLTSGEVKIDGTMAYVSQQAWIFNDTLRENIIFGERYEQDRYTTAVFASALEEDIKQLPNWDLTEIGERGINLSGGQKQRVSLARALYADRDIYLLDDPLSAVDAKVGQHIFKYYIKDALKGKSVVFVTHQLQYLSGCDSIYVMKDGRILECGTHHQLMTADGQYASLIRRFHSEEGMNNYIVDDENQNCDPQTIYKSIEHFHGMTGSPGSGNTTCEHHGKHESGVIRKSTELDDKTRNKSIGIIGNNMKSSDGKEKSDGKLMTTEEQKQGAVDWKTYHCYVKKAGGYWVAVLVLLLFLLTAGSVAACSWWLAYWIIQRNEIRAKITINSTDEAVTIYESDETEMLFYIYVFLGILATLITTTILRCLAYVKATLNSSSNLHDQLFKKVFRSPMSFFDTTPSGRILNRFSRDQDEVDVWLPSIMEEMLTFMSVFVFSCLSIVIVFPWLLLALIPFALIIMFTFKYYHHAMRDCKRLENITRSPWFSHVTATIQGLPTIHAYQSQNKFRRKFAELLDKNTVAFYLFTFCGRWAGMRLDSVAIITTFLTGLMTVLSRGSISPTLCGLALSYSVQFTGQFQFCIRLAAEVEARMTSVERMNYYLKTLSAEEASKASKNCPPDSWPSQGKLQVENLAVRYRDNLPLALKGVTFIVDSMEKVGIVGRTGAGKSSLGVSLFRLVEPTSGTIHIDGINISDIRLHDLRSRLSVIPQDPVLFVGTIRYNLDPFDQYSDEEIWKSLEKTHLKNMVRDLEGKLEAPVIENGENFSVGERQLICMARALLRRCKILVLDEATAAIDTETDSLIQQTLRDAFTNCTMLIIAHRLNTVLNCDKILVMDDGRVVEYDSPSVLLSNPDSWFGAMMSASEKTTDILK